MDIQAIEVNNITKHYRLHTSTMDRIADIIGLKRKQSLREFYALKDVSFKVKKGTIVGIIGQNGSGKSTLLKIICGVLQPTGGAVNIKGKIAALLELGAGFNPEFTGRENVYMNGALMGFSRTEMDLRLPEIEAFAEIGNFMDQPVKTYSHGMFVRLAFASAVNVDPDILIVDEALSVGDMYFQHRCISKMGTFQDQGKTILLVTHDINLIKRFCSSAVLLNEGTIIANGDPEHVTEQYILLVRERQTKDVSEGFRIRKKNRSAFPGVKINFGSKAGHILDVKVLNKAFKETPMFLAGDTIVIRIQVQVDPEVKNPSVGFMLRDQRGYDIYGVTTEQLGKELVLDQNRQALIFFSLSAVLAAGSYSLSVALVDYGEINMPPGIVLDKQVGVGTFKVLWNNYRFTGIVDLRATVLEQSEVA